MLRPHPPRPSYAVRHVSWGRCFRVAVAPSAPLRRGAHPLLHLSPLRRPGQPVDLGSQEIGGGKRRAPPRARVSPREEWLPCRALHNVAGLHLAPIRSSPCERLIPFITERRPPGHGQDRLWGRQRRRHACLATPLRQLSASPVFLPLAPLQKVKSRRQGRRKESPPTRRPAVRDDLGRTSFSMPTLPPARPLSPALYPHWLAS